MSLEIDCSIHNTQLEEPGALVITPPEPGSFNGETVTKLHLCTKCWEEVEEFMAYLYGKYND